MSIQAIILAGGEGSRLRPLTKNRPKVLLPVANKPILGHLLDAVVDAGIRDITVVVGYRQEQVLKYIADYKISIDTAVQKRQLGVYDAIQSASSKFHADQIMIIAGDNYVDSESLKKLTMQKNAILVASSSIPEEYGLIHQENGCLKELLHNQKGAQIGSLVSCGAYILERKNLEIILEHNGFETTPNLKKIKIAVIKADDWEDAVTPVCLLKQNGHLLSRHQPEIHGKIDKTAILRGHVSVGEGTEIGPNTVIVGPVVIGENTIIHGNVSIGPGTSIGSHVTLEPFTYVANSIIMNDVFIGAQSRIVDSVIGEGAVLEHTISASKNGIGAIIGDRATIGPFTQLKGTSIGNNAVIEGSKLLSEEEIPDNARVI